VARWSLATGVNEAGLAVGRYKYSWLTDHPLAWDAAVDAVADLNADISEAPAGRCRGMGSERHRLVS
jgi:hypothetical protein